MMIATAPLHPWRGDAAMIRAHGDAMLRALGVPPSTAPGMLAAAINPVGGDPFSPALKAGLGSLLGAVRSRDPSEASTAGARLTGLGAGATPLGDDYLLGAVVVIWAMGEAAGFAGAPRDRWVNALIPADAERRTSPVSASLLAAGARGRAPLPLHAILKPGRPDLASAMAAVTAIGATSGRGCATAVGAAALMLGDPASPRRTRKQKDEAGGMTPA